MIACKFCYKECKSKHSVIAHEVHCKSNPLAKPKISSRGMSGKRGSNQWINAKKNGIEYKVSSETSKKFSDASKRQVWDDERKLRHSLAMKQAVSNHPDSYTASNRGRTKQIIFDGIKFQGNWELVFYKYCKENSILIERSNEWFPYEWNGHRKYFPDFYLPEQELYVEVKGYETERDRAKWSAFPKKLIVVKKAEISAIQKGIWDCSLIGKTVDS